MFLLQVFRENKRIENLFLLCQSWQNAKYCFINSFSGWSESTVCVCGPQTCVFLNSTSFICSFTAKLYHFYFLCLGDLKLWNNLSKLKSSSCLKAMFHFFKIYQYKCTFFSHKVLYFIFITKALNILKFIYHNNNTTFNSMLIVLK